MGLEPTTPSGLLVERANLDHGIGHHHRVDERVDRIDALGRAGVGEAADRHQKPAGSEEVPAPVPLLGRRGDDEERAGDDGAQPTRSIRAYNQLELQPGRSLGAR